MYERSSRRRSCCKSTRPRGSPCLFVPCIPTGAFGTESRKVTVYNEAMSIGRHLFYKSHQVTHYCVVYESPPGPYQAADIFNIGKSKAQSTPANFPGVKCQLQSGMTPSGVVSCPSSPPFPQAGLWRRPAMIPALAGRARVKPPRTRSAPISIRPSRGRPAHARGSTSDFGEGFSRPDESDHAGPEYRLLVAYSDCVTTLRDGRVLWKDPAVPLGIFQQSL